MADIFWRKVCKIGTKKINKLQVRLKGMHDKAEVQDMNKIRD
jgi:hypothetical protein